jgi:glucokinase
VTAPAPTEGADAGRPLAVGVDIGGTKLLAARVDADGTIAGSPLYAPAPRTPGELVTAVLAAAKELSGDGGPSAIGVGVPGLVDAAGRLVFAPNLAGANGAAVGEGLQKGAPGATIWVGNDATAAGWAEFRAGAGAGYSDMLMVTLGTGIGGGVVVGGRLVEGAHRFAGEFGHMVVDPNGPHCPCGKRGCWERYASGAGLGVLARELAMAGRAAELAARAGGDPEDVMGEHVTAAAADGDPAAIEIMSRFGWWVALGLANLANLFDPEVIVIGGGLIGAGEVLMGPIKAAFDDLIEAGGMRPMPELVAAHLGPRAGAVGAGLLAL